MKIIYNKIFLEHDIYHPENKERLSRFKSLKDTSLENGEKYLSLVHTASLIEYVKERAGKELPLDADTMTCKKSYEVACFAAGAAIQAAERDAFALLRPPGHHASSSRSAGFCIFNNVAIAAKYLLNKKKRVFIFDFDLHHGNGTQDIFLGEKNIMYFSMHQSPQYPGTGIVSEGNCINVPLSMGTGDDEYMGQLETKLIPALRKFKPDIVGVSAGFDGYYRDYGYMNPTAGFKLTSKTYEKIKEIIGEYKSFYVLEGGYNPESIYEGVNVFIKEA